LVDAAKMSESITPQDFKPFDHLKEKGKKMASTRCEMKIA